VLAHPGPVVVDTVVARAELAMPPAVNGETGKGFTLYMLKAILSGRGDEIVELARTNLRRQRRRPGRSDEGREKRRAARATLHEPSALLKRTQAAAVPWRTLR
jgi:hypothetical protein